MLKYTDHPVMNGAYVTLQIESVILIPYVFVVNIFHPPNWSNVVSDLT